MVIVVIGVIAGGGDNTATETGAQTSEQAKNESLTSGSDTAENIYNVGDVIKANGLEITYLVAEKWEGYNEYFAPEKGYMYVRIKIAATNTADTDRYISMFDFDCYADGKKVEQSYESDDALAGGSLSSGRSDEGYIYFTVPEAAKEIEIEYETGFWTDQKAILKVVL